MLNIIVFAPTKEQEFSSVFAATYGSSLQSTECITEAGRADYTRVPSGTSISAIPLLPATASPALKSAHHLRHLLSHFHPLEKIRETVPEYAHE